MACGIKVIAAFLACVTAASAVFAPFPHGKTTVYKYRTVVKTAITEESLYASQFVLQGTLDITHDVRDPNLVNAYTVVLSNLTTDMHNGKNVDYDEKPVLQSIDIAARVMQLPFQIIYKTDGTFQAFKIDANEFEWSWYMKMAIATMLQLDFPHINMEKLADEPLSFVTQEETIHGNCSVSYNVYSVDQVNANTSEEFRVKKTFSPIDCNGFMFNEFNNVDNDHCKTKKPEHMFTKSTTDIRVEKQGEEILIKKLVAHGSVKVVSANGAIYPFFVITNTTFEFLQINENSKTDTRVRKFMNSPKVDAFWKLPGYTISGAVDPTMGRHRVNLSSLPAQLEKLLSEAFNYIENNNLSPTEINWSHAQTINNILRTMSYMNSEALQETFDIFENSVSRRATQIKNIFFGVVAQVGTPAACNFTVNLILKNKISATAAVDMLGRLPLSVKVPTESLWIQMKRLLEFDDSIPVEVRKAAILSFSSLTYRTYKNSNCSGAMSPVQNYLKNFLEHVKDEQTYEMKVIYLMAIKNIQVGRIYDLLEPIINGSHSISENPERFQLLAIWAIDKAAEEDYAAASQILWPVMLNESLSTKLRIAAYEILVNQAPDEKSVRNVHHWVISAQRENVHFWHYHYTTFKSIAQSANQCKNNLRTIVRSILEDMESPLDAHIYIKYPLSGVQTLGYIDDTFIHAEKFDLRVTVNELTGVPEVVQIEQETVDRNGAISDIAIQVHIEGNHELSSILRPAMDRGLKPAKVLEVLEKASRSVPARKNLEIDIVLMRNGRVIITKHYDLENLAQLHDDLMYYQYYMTDTYSINYQSVAFDRLYEKRLFSDIGVPVIVETRIPIVTSIKINHTNTKRWPLSLGWDVNFKRWEHQDHSMSVYNPIKDVWHAVRAVTVHEVAIPFRVNMTKGKIGSLKLSFPERLEDSPWAAGFLIRGKHLVTVDEEGTRALSESCNTCLNQEDIHDDTQPLDDHDECEDRDFDLRYIGLNVTSYLYPGNNAYRSESYLGDTTTWDNSFRLNVSHRWTGAIVHGMMNARRGWKNAVLKGYQNRCGGHLKIEPSTDNSISEIDIKLRGKYEDHDKNEKSMELAHSETWRFTATVDMISSLTNTSAGLWNLDVDVHKNRGHLKNKVSVKIIRKAPEEENLKICIDTAKHYPARPADELNLPGTNEEIDSEVTVAYGHGYDEDCHRNETLISLNLKAELSDVQKSLLEHESNFDNCKQNIKSPYYGNPMTSIPRRTSCVNDAIFYTTPRKYTFNVTFKLMPDTPIEHFVFAIPDDEEYGARGNLQLLVEFPIYSNTIEMEVVANSTSMSTVNVDLRNILSNGQGPVLRPQWDYPLDNSRFALKFLSDYNDGEIRLCSVYPQLVIRGKGNSRRFIIPSDEWALISGDHWDKRFAIFTQQPRPEYLSFLIFIRNHRIHFFTRESDNVLVAVADDIESEMEEGFRLPMNANYGWNLKVTKDYDHFVVRMWEVPLTLRVGPKYMSIDFGSELQGHISGLCSHLNIDMAPIEPDIFLTKDIESIVMENVNEDTE